jgi:hypothetical protein
MGRHLTTAGEKRLQSLVSFRWQCSEGAADDLRIAEKCEQLVTGLGLRPIIVEGSMMCAGDGPEHTPGMSL